MAEQTRDQILVDVLLHNVQVETQRAKTFQQAALHFSTVARALALALDEGHDNGSVRLSEEELQAAQAVEMDMTADGTGLVLTLRDKIEEEAPRG